MRTAGLPRTAPLALLVMLVLTAGGCTATDDRTTTAPEAHGGLDATVAQFPAPRPQRSLRPDLLVLEPNTVAPGTTLEVRFLGEDARGVAFTLQQATEDSWVVRYTYVARAGQPTGGSWIPAGDAVTYPDVGDSGPLTLKLPMGLEPGDYGFCTENAGDDYCAPPEVAWARLWRVT